MNCDEKRTKLNKKRTRLAQFIIKKLRYYIEFKNLFRTLSQEVFRNHYVSLATYKTVLNYNMWFLTD